MPSAPLGAAKSLDSAQRTWGRKERHQRPHHSRLLSRFWGIWVAVVRGPMCPWTRASVGDAKGRLCSIRSIELPCPLPQHNYLFLVVFLFLDTDEKLPSECISYNSCQTCFGTGNLISQRGESWQGYKDPPASVNKGSPKTHTRH